MEELKKEVGEEVELEESEVLELVEQWVEPPDDDEEEKKIPDIFYEMEELRQMLSRNNVESMRAFIKQHLADEAQMLLDYYNREIVGILAPSDPFRMEVSALLQNLGFRGIV